SAAAAGPAAAETAEAAASAAAEPASAEAAPAESSDAAGPVAPRTAAPVPAAPRPVGADENDDDEDDPEQRADRETAAGTGSPPRGLDGHVWHDDAAPFRDAVDERGRSREQALAVAALAELRPDDVANFAGEAVRDDALEAVADLDAERAILHGDDD